MRQGVPPLAPVAARGHVDRKVMPTLARIILEQTAAAEAPPREEDVVACDTAIEQDYKTQLTEAMRRRVGAQCATATLTASATSTVL